MKKPFSRISRSKRRGAQMNSRERFVLDGVLWDYTTSDGATHPFVPTPEDEADREQWLTTGATIGSATRATLTSALLCLGAAIGSVLIGFSFNVERWTEEEEDAPQPMWRGLSESGSG